MLRCWHWRTRWEGLNAQWTTLLQVGSRVPACLHRAGGSLALLDLSHQSWLRMCAVRCMEGRPLLYTGLTSLYGHVQLRVLPVHFALLEHGQRGVTARVVRALD